MAHEIIFTLDADDLIVSKQSVNGRPTYYYLDIEGYIGFETLDSFVSLYNSYLNRFETFLREGYSEPDRSHNWKVVYRTRSIEICFQHGYYWIFLDTYRSHNIWDLYEYLKDVINQIKEASVKLTEQMEDKQ